MFIAGLVGPVSGASFVGPVSGAWLVVPVAPRANPVRDLVGRAECSGQEGEFHQVRLGRIVVVAFSVLVRVIVRVIGSLIRVGSLPEDAAEEPRVATVVVVAVPEDAAEESAVAAVVIVTIVVATSEETPEEAAVSTAVVVPVVVTTSEETAEEPTAVV